MASSSRSVCFDLRRGPVAPRVVVQVQVQVLAVMAMVMLGAGQARAQAPGAATVTLQAPDPVLLPLTGGAGAAVGGLAGSAVALGLALAAQNATGEEITDEARTLNQLTTFGTLVAPALLSVAGAVVGAAVVATA